MIILRQQYPNVRLHSSSGDTLNVYSALDKGVADFGLIFEHPNPETYEFLTLPEEDRFGVLMRQDAPLARKTVITAEDLAEQPLIVQRVMLNMAKQTAWNRDYRKRAKVAGSEHIRYVGNRAEEWRTLLSKAKIAGSYSLLFNASLMVRAGMGYAIGLDRILNLPKEGDLCFRPLSPEWTATPHLIWKRYQVFSQSSETFSGAAAGTEIKRKIQASACIFYAFIHKVVLVVNANNPMELDWTENYPQIGAIILAPGTGSNAMEALGKIMDGEVNPSGRTIETYLYDLTTSPSYNNSGAFNFDNVQQYQADNTAADPAYQGTLSFVIYVEDIYVGYKFYETAYAEAQDGNMDFDYDTNVQFPFGHGLSYTAFTQEITGFEHNETSVSVDVTVTNTGAAAGKDVVELYFTPPYSNGGIEKAAVNLINFGKTRLLEPGVSEVVHFDVPLEDMASYDSKGVKAQGGGYVLEAGEYVLSVRGNSHTVLDEETLTVDADVEYDDPRWDTLLDQLSVDEMAQLVNLGGFQTVAVESVGKGAALDSDGTAGLNDWYIGVYGTPYPAEILISQTWNKELAARVGTAYAQEFADVNVYGWYGPAMNTHRTAFNGRSFEYFSEDGVLAGYIASAEVNAAAEKGVYAFIKHFVMNDQETNRCTGLLTYSDEQVIREIYMKPFELVVKNFDFQGHKPLAVMSSFNFIGDVWAGSNSDLLNDVLRGEWGFKGMVLTDWNGSYGYQNIDDAIRNGNDLMLGFMQHQSNVLTDLDSPTLVNALRQASKNILFTVGNSGYYTNPTQESGMDKMTAMFVAIDVAVMLVVVAIMAVVILRWRKKQQKAQ